MKAIFKLTSGSVGTLACGHFAGRQRLLAPRASADSTHWGHLWHAAYPLEPSTLYHSEHGACRKLLYVGCCVRSSLDKGGKLQSKEYNSHGGEQLARMFSWRCLPHQESNPSQKLATSIPKTLDFSYYTLYNEVRGHSDFLGAKEGGDV